MDFVASNDADCWERDDLEDLFYLELGLLVFYWGSKDLGLVGFIFGDVDKCELVFVGADYEPFVVHL